VAETGCAARRATEHTQQGGRNQAVHWQVKKEKIQLTDCHNRILELLPWSHLAH